MVLELREQEGKKRGRRKMEREGRRGESEGQGLVTASMSWRDRKKCQGRGSAGDPGDENPPCKEKDAGLMPGGRGVTKPAPQLQSPGATAGVCALQCKILHDAVRVLHAATKTRHSQIIN